MPLSQPNTPWPSERLCALRARCDVVHEHDPAPASKQQRRFGAVQPSADRIMEQPSSRGAPRTGLRRVRRASRRRQRRTARLRAQHPGIHSPPVSPKPQLGPKCQTSSCIHGYLHSTQCCIPEVLALILISSFVGAMRPENRMAEPGSFRESLLDSFACCLHAYFRMACGAN